MSHILTSRFHLGNQSLRSSSPSHMEQEGTSPVPSQDHTHLSNTSSPATSKVPRTLSFISNVQTAVAQIEDKLANSPSASPPPPNRNEIPVTPPGPDHPVIDRVQFLESSLAISPSKRTKISSLADSVFGGAINPDPSLAPAGVFVSTTPRPNLNATVTNPSASPKPSNPQAQADTHVINDPTSSDPTANSTGTAAPHIAPIVEQFETPISPVFSKENDSEIVGPPIAPIVEQFEGPVTVKDSINQQDLVDFASGTVAPIVDQVEHSTIPDPEADVLEQAEASDSKQAVTDSQRLRGVGESEALPHEIAETVGTAEAYSEAEQASTSGADGKQDGSREVQTLPAAPLVEGLDSLLDDSLGSGSPSKEEAIQTETVKSGTGLLTVPPENGAAPISPAKNLASSELSGVRTAQNSHAESPHGVHEGTSATSEGSESRRAAITNDSETGKEHEADQVALLAETELPLSSRGAPLLSVNKKEDTSVITSAKTVLRTETCAEGANINSSSDAFVDDDCKTNETATTPEETESQATNADDDGTVDDEKAEGLRIKTVETVTAHGKGDSTSLKDLMLKETTGDASAETLKSVDGKSTTFATNAATNETTTAIVSPMVQSSNDEIATGDAIDNSSSVDETTKTRMSETGNSDEGVSEGVSEGVNDSANDENALTEEPAVSATDVVDSSAKSKSACASTTAEAADKPVTEMLDPAGEARGSSKIRTLDPTVNVGLPVTKTIPGNRSSISPESIRPLRGLVENGNILNSAAQNHSATATALGTDVTTPDIQLDNSMNITIVVQTTSAPVSAGVTISTDDLARAGKHSTPRSAHNVSGDGQGVMQDFVTSTLKGPASNPASNEESETATKAIQENHMVSAGTPTVSPGEVDGADDVKENEVTYSHTDERDSDASHGEQSATLEQEPLDTVKKRALVAREKLSSPCPDRAAESRCKRSPKNDLPSETEKMKPAGMRDASCDSSDMGSNRSTTWGNAVRSKSISHVDHRSPAASSKGADTGTGDRNRRQPFTRGAITQSPGARKMFATAGPMRKQKKPPQSAPTSPLRLPKSSSQSLPRVPRVAGLSNTRSSSLVRARSSLTEGTSARVPRPSSSLPRSNSRLSSPLLTRQSGLSSSPVTPKSTSKPSTTARLPLRRTLSFTNSRMFDSPNLAASRTRYSLSQKVEEMKRASSNRASAAHVSGSGSKPPLGRRARVTVPEPFALFGPELHEMSEKQMDDARRKQDEEAARPRVFVPRPMPNFSKADGSQIVRKDETRN